MAQVCLVTQLKGWAKEKKKGNKNTEGDVETTTEQEVTKSKAETQKVHKQEDTQKHERKRNKTKVTSWWTSKQLQWPSGFMCVLKGV